MKTQLLRISALVFGIVVSINSFGQELAPKNLATSVPSPALEKCGSQVLHQMMMETDPAYRQVQEELEVQTKSYSKPKAGGVIYRIPVVVHVLYHNGADPLGVELQNVTDSQIQDAVKNVNQQFRKWAGTSWVGTTVNAADAEIELALAVRDPSGNCTTGITRHNVSNSADSPALTAAQRTAYENAGQGSGGITDAQVKAIGRWFTASPRRYYEIWLVTELNNSNAGSGTKGYATLPGTHNTNTDGAVMEGRDFLSPTSSTFAHEMAHSLNLHHTFVGDDVSPADGVPESCPSDVTIGTNSDGCADTPRHMRDNGSFSSCVPGTANCAGGGTAAEHIYNYMDYSLCNVNEFTTNQVARMSAVMDPSTGTRRSLLGGAPNNCMSLVPPTMSGAATFTSDRTIVCAGESISFFDKTSCVPNMYLDEADEFPGLTHDWDIVNSTNGAETYTSARINPTVTPTGTGKYNVTLTVTGAAPAAVGTKTATVNEYFYVAPTPTAATTTPMMTSAVTGNFGQTVSRVQFNTLDNSTSSTYNAGSAGYQNLTCSKNTSVTGGSAYTLTVTVNGGGSGSQFVEVDIDWNNDGDFADAGEDAVLTGSAATNSTASPSALITVPATATKDRLLRMRVMTERATSISATRQAGTTSYSMGEVEDYGIYIPTPTPLGPVPSATTHPSDATICENGNATFTTAWINAPTSYVWQESTDGGGVWNNITDGGVYSGATTDALTITGAPVSMSGYQYRCEASNVDGPGLSNAATLTVNPNPAAPTITPSGPTTFCDGGSVDLTSSYAGAGNLWTPNGETTDVITASVSGNYDVTYTDGNGCSATSAATVVTVNPNPVIAVGTVVNPTTCLGTDGSIEITGAGTGTLSYTGTASGSLPATTLPATVTGLTAGSYDFTFTDGNGCVSNIVVQALTDPAPPATPTIMAMGATTFCDGGSVDLMSSSATDNSWTPGAETTQTITVSTSGSYEVTVTDPVTLCSATSLPEVVTVNTNPVIAPGTLTNPSTCATATGSIEVTGAGTGDVSWTGTATGTDMGVPLPHTIMSLAAGNYDITFTDGNGCVSNTVNATLTDPGAPATPIITPSGPTTFCDGGSVDLTSSAENAYSWAPGGEITQTITVTVGGNYTVTVTDISGCSATSAPFTVTVNPLPATPTITPSGPTTFCTGGMVDLTSSSATDNVWSPGGETTQTIMVMASGTYAVTVTDGNGCSATSLDEVVTINPNPAITEGTLTNPTTCTGTDGSIEVNGAGTGDVSWTGTASGSAMGVALPYVITGLGAGTYDITYTESGCVSNTVTSVLTDPAAPVIAEGTLTAPTTCGGTDGSIEVTGAGTGDVSWTGTASGSAIGVTLPYVITGLGAGTYDITYTESACVSNIVSSTLSDPPTPTAPVITPSGPTTFCAGGSVDLTSDIATDIVWAPNGETTPTITASVAGTYSVTYTDPVTMCTATSATVDVIVNPLPVVPTITPSGPTTFCDGGSVDLTSSVEASYLWTPNGETTQSITVTVGGNYDVTVTDINGCSATSAIAVVTVNPNPSILLGTITDPTVCGAADATIEVTGGAGTFDVNWNGTASGSNAGVTLPNTIMGLTAGFYSISVTDANGCISNFESASINDPGAPPSPTITPDGPTTFCAGADVVLSSSPTIGTYSWTSGDITQDITVTTSGTYAVVITEAGCSSTSLGVIVTVNPLPAAPTITPSGPTTFCDGGSVDLTSSETTGIVWSPNGETTATITVSVTDNYSVAYTDGNGCSAASAVTAVTVNPNPVIAIGTTAGPTTCSGTDGSIEITGAGTGDLNWTGTVTGPGSAVGVTLPATISTFAADSYDFTFTDGTTGCVSGTVSTTIADPAAPVIAIGTTAGPTTCSGTDGSIEITGAGTGDLSWTGIATGPGSAVGVTLPVAISTFAADAYDFTFTEANGCVSNTVSTTIADPAAPTAPVITPSGSTTFCSGGSVDLTSDITTDIIWSPNGETTATITALAAGNYSVTYTDPTTLCAATSLVEVVTVNPTPAAPVITPSGPTSFCAGGSVDLTSDYVGGNVWSPNGETTDFITVIADGTYSVTVTVGGCTSAPSAGVVVTILPSTTIAVGAVTQPAPCAGTTGSIEITGTGSGDISWAGPTPGLQAGVTLPFTITGLSAGAYTISFVNTDGCASTDVAQTLTDVTPPPTPIITPGGPTTFCAGGSVVLTSSAASDNVWAPNGETTSSIPVSAGGSYSVTVTNAAGCTATSAVTTVTVNPIPVIAVGTAVDPGCASSNGSIEITGVGTGDLSWTGATVGTLPGVTLPATITGLPGGAFTITFVSTDGCTSNTVSHTLIDSGFPTTPVITTDGPTTFCSPGSVTLTAPSAGSYSWAPFGQTTQSITVAASGNYSVTISNAGCSGTSGFVQVVVNPPLDIEISANTPLCAGQTLVLTASPIPGGNYSWTGPGFASISPNTVSIPSVATTNTGMYRLTVEANGCQAKDSVFVVVNALPSVSFGAVPAICKTHNAVLLTQGSPAGGSYSGTGVVMPGGQQFNPQDGLVVANTTITLTYTYSNGNCSNTATSTIFVDDCAGLEEESGTILNVYPNPSNGKVTVAAEGGMVVAVTVYDNLGKLVRVMQTINNEIVELDLSNVAAGVYTFEVVTDAAVERKQIVINH